MKACSAWALALTTWSMLDSGMTRQVLCQSSLLRDSWKTHILEALSHLPWQFFKPPPLCQSGKGVTCCNFSPTQHGQGQLCAGGGWEGPLRNAFTRGRFHAGYERVKRAQGKHKDHCKYQGDLKAMVSFSQWLFKDSEYLDSFSFPVRNQRIFLEMFLLFTHLSNSGSL